MKNAEPKEDPISRRELPEMATKKQLASYLQVSDQHVEKLTKDGVIPQIRLGRVIRFPTGRVLARLSKRIEANQPARSRKHVGNVIKFPTGKALAAISAKVAAKYGGHSRVMAIGGRVPQP